MDISFLVFLVLIICILYIVYGWPRKKAQSDTTELSDSTDSWVYLGKGDNRYCSRYLRPDGSIVQIRSFPESAFVSDGD